MTTTRVTHYRTASPETWSLIRGAYLSGLSAPTVGARFGAASGAIRKPAKREGWTKRDYAARATPWPGGLPPQSTVDKNKNRTKAFPMCDAGAIGDP